VFRVAAAYLIVAWLLLQVGDTLAPALHLPESVNSALAFFLIVGFPLALVFAWAFEVTPEGIKREKDVDPDRSITYVTGQKLNRTIMIVLALAVAFFIFDKFVLDPGRDAAEIEAAIQDAQELAARPVASPDDAQSIAVLPFLNMSDDAANEYFSDGLAEELLNLLAKVPELRVAARTSSFQFKDRTGNIAEIAGQLKVANILEGSVRKAGNQVRITAQLIKADDGYHLWSETYDRQLDNIFQIQDEIARAVVDALKVRLLGAAPKVRETNPEAYALYLQGRFHLNARSEANYAKAARAFREALAIDPAYAAAWAGLARVLSQQAGFGYIEFGQGLTDAREAAEEAVRQDPELALGWVALSQLQGTYDWDWQAADASMNKALALEPANSEVQHQAASLACALGRLRECLAILERAMEQDPLNQHLINALASVYENVNRLEEAERLGRQLVSINPDFSSAHVNLAWILLRQGRIEEARTELEKDTELGWKSLTRAMVLHSAGEREAADREVEAFERDYHEFWAYQAAEIRAWRGEVGRAFAWLERAYAQHDPGLSSLLQDSSLRSLHGDPRWEALLERMGLLEAWNAMSPEFKGLRS
jgi:adenylate cyclase